jgi:hypothetical protein
MKMSESINDRRRLTAKWLARALAIGFACFLALFSLDVIQPGAKIQEIFIGLIIHNIPVFVLILVIILAWRKEIVGAVTFYLAALLYIILLLSSRSFQSYMLVWVLMISGPAALVGTLYLFAWRGRVLARGRFSCKL